MFEEVLSEGAIDVVESLSPHLETFYLAGGTGLALQLRHRRSDDFDFFFDTLFNTDALLSLISHDKVLFTSLGTVHFPQITQELSLRHYSYPSIFASNCSRNREGFLEKLSESS